MGVWGYAEVRCAPKALLVTLNPLALDSGFLNPPCAAGPLNRELHPSALKGLVLDLGNPASTRTSRTLSPPPRAAGPLNCELHPGNNSALGLLDDAGTAHAVSCGVSAPCPDSMVPSRAEARWVTATFQVAL